MSKVYNARKFSKIMRGMTRVPSQASAQIAKEIKRDIENQMERSQDPYGRPWRERADGSRSTLFRTGAGRASIQVRAMAGAGWQIIVGLVHMIYHQFGGASHLRGPGGSFKLRHKNKDFGRDKDRSSGRNKPPKRSFLPFDRMPSRWEKIVKDAYERVMRRRLAGG